MNCRRLYLTSEQREVVVEVPRSTRGRSCVHQGETDKDERCSFCIPLCNTHAMGGRWIKVHLEDSREVSTVIIVLPASGLHIYPSPFRRLMLITIFKPPPRPLEKPSMCVSAFNKYIRNGV